MRILHGSFGTSARVALVGLAWLGQAAFAHAATFSVSPTRITLGSATTSAVMTITNHGTETMRFQLSAFGWDHTDEGQMILSDTGDVVVYPSMVVIEPQQSRRIRIAVSAPPAPTERTYRVFVEELPNRAGAPTAGMGIQVRTRMGVPVFVAGARQTANVSLANLEVRDGALLARVTNGGTRHAVLQRLTVEGRSADGETVLRRAVDGWYLLAGRRRFYRIELPAEACSDASSLTVVAELEGGRVSERLPLPAGACASR